MLKREEKVLIEGWACIPNYFIFTFFKNQAIQAV